MTKKNVLVISSVFFTALIFLVIFQETCNYDSHGFCWKYWTELGDISGYILIFTPVFFISLITYKMRDEIFVTWIKFTTWWVLGTLILVLIAPAHDPSLLPVTKEVISLLSTGAFTVISLITVAHKWSTTRKKK